MYSQKYLIALGVFMAFLMSFLSNATAEEEPGVVLKHADKVVEKVDEPRYKLRDDVLSDSQVSGERKLEEADFTWKAISKNGPASGANPIIGEDSNKPYMDFSDGTPYPYFIADR